MPTPSPSPSRGCAVVIGASMAGLLAARVLADRFDRVIVVERDQLPSGPEYRRGVPQARHLHALLKRGTDILTELFPGLADDLCAAGATMVKVSEEMRIITPAGILPRIPVAGANLGATRPLIEHHVRRRVADMPTVDIRAQTTVADLVADRDRVVGVRLVDKASGAESGIDTDLVVDASGRAGQVTRWLEALGFPAPTEQTLMTNLTYVTRTVRMADVGGDRLVLVMALPGRPSGIGAAAVGPDTWMLTLFGYGSHQPSGGAGAFGDQLAAVSPPDLVEAVEAGEPLDEKPDLYRFPTSLRRRFERLDRFPAGLVVVGDAVCSFNPIYGQGMTVAAQEALVLGDWLDEGSDQPLRFLRRAAKAIRPAWDTSSGADLSLPEVEGPRPPMTRVLGAYMTRVQVAAVADPEVARRFIRVVAMLDPPSRLLSPAFAARVARHSISRRTTRSVGVAQPS